MSRFVTLTVLPPTSSCDALAIVCVCEGNCYALIVPKSRYSLGKLRLSKSLPLHSRSRFSASAAFLVRTFALIAAMLAANSFLSLGRCSALRSKLSSLPTEATTLHQTLRPESRSSLLSDKLLVLVFLPFLFGLAAAFLAGLMASSTLLGTGAFMLRSVPLGIRRRSVPGASRSPFNPSSPRLLVHVGIRTPRMKGFRSRLLKFSSRFVLIRRTACFYGRRVRAPFASLVIIPLPNIFPHRERLSFDRCA